MKDGNFTVNEDKCRFELEIDQQTAFIEYRKSGDNYSLIHTEVPESLEGQGVGKKLVISTLEHLKANNKTFTPSCTFVAVYVKRNPQWEEFIAK